MPDHNQERWTGYVWCSRPRRRVDGVWGWSLTLGRVECAALGYASKSSARRAGNAFAKRHGMEVTWDE